jgi:hypothetical protein
MALNYLSSLSVADDQMANQFEVEFSSVPVYSGDASTKASTTELKFRMDRSIDIPETKVATYDIEYRGMKSPMISQKEDFDKSVTLNFRLDENWKIYNALQSWYKTAFDPNSGIRGGVSDYSVTMTFKAYAGSFLKKTITFNQVRIKSLKLETFDHGSSDPSRVECAFIYSYSTFGQA